MTFSDQAAAIASFADACERLNDFARELRKRYFENVRAGADIRSYEDGWRLEKWVEGEVNEADGLWATWWLELGRANDQWIVESHITVSPDEFFHALEMRRAATTEDLGRALKDAVDELRRTFVDHGPFRECIDRNRP